MKNNPKIFFEEWDDPIITGIKWVSELVEIAGGIDIFKSYSSKPNAIDRIIKNSDQVVYANPDIIFASWCGKKLNKDKKHKILVKEETIGDGTARKITKTKNGVTMEYYE